MKNLFTSFNKRIFILILIILLIVGFKSYAVVFSLEDGVLENNSLNQFLSFPYLMLSYTARYFDNMFLFYCFLVLHILLFSMILERIIYLAKASIKKQLR